MATTDEILSRLTMSVDEAAQVLGISRNSAYDAVRAGDIEVVRIGKRIRVITNTLRKKLGMEAIRVD